MASHNLDLARSVVGDLHGMFDLFDEDIVWDSRAYELPHGVTMLERGLYRGKRAVIDHIKDYVGTWSDYRFEVEELAEVADSVVLTVHETARGRGSGVPMEHRYCQVWTFHGGRIIRGGTYHDSADALAALAAAE